MTRRNKIIVGALLLLFVGVAFTSSESSPKLEESEPQRPAPAPPPIPSPAPKPPEPRLTEESGPQQPTPTPTPVPAPKPPEPRPKVVEDTGQILVTRVVDGDTVEIEGGQKVRYIGIDTPETVHPSKPVGCFGQQASTKNKELVEGKKAKFEKDISETDKYGRLLRYVWVGDIFVNDFLVRQGYATSSTYPPDVKYQNQFVEAEREARENNRGLWGACQTGDATPTPQTPSSGGTYTCDCSKLCPQMSSCEEAYYQLNVCGCSKRDGDKDSIPCESICSGGL